MQQFYLHLQYFLAGTCKTALHIEICKAVKVIRYFLPYYRFPLRVRELL